jgi:predicted esterase
MKTLFRRCLASFLRILAGIPIVSLFIGGLLYLVLSETLMGRSVGLSAIMLAGILFCSIGYWNREWFKKIRKRFFAVSISVAVLLYVVPMILAPSGGHSYGQVRNCFLRGEGSYCPYSPWNVVPEVDQIKVGTCLIPFGMVDFAEAARLRSLLLPIYEELENDADFHDLGSQLGSMHRELAHLEFRTGHYYLFLPPMTSWESTSKIPCLIFLHGMGGNSKTYVWLLSKLSKQKTCAIIAPTFGLGSWDKPGSEEFIVDVAREAIATLPIDPKRIYLMGYSNGGMGVTRAAIQSPELFRGLIYISPVTEDELFSTKEFLSRAKDRKILFLQGGQDKRIPRNEVEKSVDYLNRLGCDTRLKLYEDEDHYLIFSQQDAVLADILECMKKD